MYISCVYMYKTYLLNVGDWFPIDMYVSLCSYLNRKPVDHDLEDGTQSWRNRHQKAGNSCKLNFMVQRLFH